MPVRLALRCRAVREMDAGVADDVLSSRGRASRQFNRVLLSSIIQWFSMMLAIPAESELWMRAYGSDFAGQARMLGTLSSAGAVIGFVVNPILGALAESYGRKFTMMVSQLVAVVKSAILVASPSPAAMIFSNLMMPLTIGSWEMGSHCTTADLFRAAPVQLAAAKGKLQMVPSVCAVLCPIVGAWLAARDLRWAFGSQAGLWLLNSILTLQIADTVPKEERKPFAWTAANPLSVVQLFVRGHRLRVLAVSQILNELTEMRSLYQVYDLSRTQVLGMNMAQRSRFTSFASFFSIPGYLLAEPLLRSCGELGASVLGLLTFAAQNCVWGASSLAWQFYAAQPLGLLRGVASVALNTRLTLDGAAAGLTQGELQGALNNLQTICQAAAPMLWGRLYASGTAKVRSCLRYAVRNSSAILCGWRGTSAHFAVYVLTTLWWWCVWHAVAAQTPPQPGMFYFVIAGTAVAQLLLAVPAAAAAKPAIVLD